MPETYNSFSFDPCHCSGFCWFICSLLLNLLKKTYLMACQRHHFSKLHVLFESKSTTCCVCKSSPGLPLDRVCRRWTPVGPPGHRGSLHFFNCCCLPQTSSLPSHFQIFRIGHGVLGAARTRHEWWMMVTSTKSRLYIYIYTTNIYIT